MLRRRSSTYLIISGVLAVIFGLIAAIDPISSILTLVVLWGWYALMDGLFAVISAFRPDERGARGYLLLTGVLGLVAGLVVITKPFSSAVTLTWILGIWMMVRGVIELGLAVIGHRAGQRLSLVLSGLLWLLAGILIASNPGAALMGISTWISVVAIIWGILLLAGGILLRSEGNNRTAL